MISLPFMSKDKPSVASPFDPSSQITTELGKTEDRRRALRVGGSALLALSFQTLGEWGFPGFVFSLLMPTLELQVSFIPTLELHHYTC
jgi:uncharacterized membrane protein YbhN (UPF0104 family)